MNCAFIQIRCKPGTGYRVADEIALREIHSELYSTSGEYDLCRHLQFGRFRPWGDALAFPFLALYGSPNLTISSA